MFPYSWFCSHMWLVKTEWENFITVLPFVWHFTRVHSCPEDSTHVHHPWYPIVISNCIIRKWQDKGNTPWINETDVDWKQVIGCQCSIDSQINAQIVGQCFVWNITIICDQVETQNPTIHIWYPRKVYEQVHGSRKHPTASALCPLKGTFLRRKSQRG